MADGDDAQYIVYVPKTEPYESTLEDDIANDVEEYGDAEFLDFSNEEGTNSNSDDDAPELLDEEDALDPGPSFKHEKGQNSSNNALTLFSKFKVPYVMMTEVINRCHLLGTKASSTGLPITFKWNHTGTLHLIEAYKSLEPLLIHDQLSINRVWDVVAKKLQSQGYEVTPLHCKNKFGSLKQIYEKNKEQEINSGVSVKKWTYMDQMESIMTEMEKYRSYSNEDWDSPKSKDAKKLNENNENEDTVPKTNGNRTVQGIYKWENRAILFLIDQYRKYQGALDSGNISQKVLFRLLEKNMQNKGFHVTANQCMIKMHSLKKTYKSIKEYNHVNRLIPRRWRYYDLIDSIVQGTPDANCDLEEVSETLAEIKSEVTLPPHMFKWSRRSIEILVSAYRDHRPPLHDTKATRHKVWEIVVQNLREEGYEVSVGQCRSKISGMLKLYRKNKSGAVGRAFSERGGWYSKLIESLVDKSPKTMQKDVPKRQLNASNNVYSSSTRTPETVLDQLVINEENRERRHRENMEQRQQLIDIMGQLLERLG